jgi:16S rRNA (adenine1518-N6/adenine1519-N6)-dimethyltransferase
VTAFEKDPKLEAPLRELLGDIASFDLQMGDFLKADLAGLSGPQAVAVGNLPYYITTPILERLLDATPPFGAVVVTVQREVGQRMMAHAGDDDYGSLTVYCQYHLEQILQVCSLGPAAFIPPPGVSSLALRLVPRQHPPEGVLSAAAFFRVVRAAFGHRRKTLRRALITAATVPGGDEAVDRVLGEAGIDGQRRGETLDFAEFARLGNALAEREVAS